MLTDKNQLLFISLLFLTFLALINALINTHIIALNFIRL